MIRIWCCYLGLIAAFVCTCIVICVGTTWMCRRCKENEPLRQKKSSEYKHLRKDTVRKTCSTGDSQIVYSVGSKTLPYDVSYCRNNSISFQFIRAMNNAAHRVELCIIVAFVLILAK